MSGYRRVNYYELCRLCTSNKGTKIHMFKEEGKRRQIPNKIQICLRLQVSEEDSLPKLICNLCLNKLEGYFDFRSNCVNAEAMLESYSKNLSFNSDFVKDGKVYIKENNLDNFDEGGANKEGLSNENTFSKGNDHLKENELKFSSHPSEILSLPVTLDNFGLIQERLIQATAVRILPDKEVSKLQNNLKSTIQVHPNIERISGEHSYSYSNQEAQATADEGCNQKINQTLNNGSTKNSSTQMMKTDVLSQTCEIVGDTSQGDCRNSVNQIGEFLKLKSATNNGENEDCLCENCGLVFANHVERATHFESCSNTLDPLKISEPVVMVDVEDDKALTNCVSPFCCDDCGKNFKRKEHLVQHKRLHTGERPFRCSQCPLTFSRKEHLLRHILCHTGEKHYSCGICGKLFGRKDNVAKHMRTHQMKTLCMTDSDINASIKKEDSLDLRYKCDTCDHSFPTQDCLKKHTSLRHSGSTDNCDLIVLNAEQPISLLEKALKQIPN